MVSNVLSQKNNNDFVFLASALIHSENMSKTKQNSNSNKVNEFELQNMKQRKKRDESILTLHSIWFVFITETDCDTNSIMEMVMIIA